MPSTHPAMLQAEKAAAEKKMITIGLDQLLPPMKMGKEELTDESLPYFNLTVQTMHGPQTVQLRHGDLAFNENQTSGIPGCVKHWGHSGVVMHGSNDEWYVMEQVGAFQITPLADIKLFSRGFPGIGFARIRNYDHHLREEQIGAYVKYMFDTFRYFGWGYNPFYADNRFVTLENPINKQKLAYCSQEIWLAWQKITGLSLDNRWTGAVTPDDLFDNQDQIFNVKLAQGCY